MKSKNKFLATLLSLTTIGSLTYLACSQTIQNNNSTSLKSNSYNARPDRKVLPATLIGAKKGTFTIEYKDPSYCVLYKVNDFLATGDYSFHEGKFVVDGVTYTITEIDDGVFAHNIDEEQKFLNCNLFIPSTIKKIGNYAFAEKNKTPLENGIINITFCNGVEFIGAHAFKNIKLNPQSGSAKILTLPSSVKKVCTSAFKNLNIESLDLTSLDHVLPIYTSPVDSEEGIIGQTDKKKYPIVILKNNEMLNKYIADDNWFTYRDYLYKSGPSNIDKEIKIKTINYGNIYSTFGDINDFSTNEDYFNIRGMKIPRNEIVSVELSGFKNTYHLNDLFLANCPNLENVDLSGLTTITELGDFFMSGNYCLKEVILPSSIMKIGNSFLRECRSLKQFTFASNHISEIGDMFMAGCRSLEIADLSSIKTFIPYQNGMFGWNPELWVIYVNEANLQQYKTDPAWKSVADIIHANK